MHQPFKKYYTASCEPDDLISIGTIGLIKGISTYRPDKGVRLATYASRCVENEVLMYFRSQRKYAGDVSLSEAIDADGEGSLSMLDVLYEEEDDLLDRLSTRESCRKLREALHSALNARERELLTLRYGLDGRPALPQREVATALRISRSYVSRRHYCKRSPESLEIKGLSGLRAFFGG